MSEWEEFCESRGFSTGEDDYEKIIDSLEKTPRQKSLSQPPPCDLNQEEVNALIKLDAHGIPKHSEISLMVWTGQTAEIGQWSLDGMIAGKDEGLIVRFREKDGDYFAPLHMLIEALRSTCLPLQLEDQLVIWDSKNECLDSWQGIFKESFLVQRTDRVPSGQDDLNMLHLLDRAKAADHSLKPLLVAATDLERALSGGVVEFIDGSSLSSETLSDAFLVYITSKGIPVSKPLRSMDEFVMELHTRNGTYKLSDGKVRTVNGPARLTAGAILLDKETKHPTYYLRADHGTIYQPVYRKVSEDDIQDHDPSNIFATDGAHPLELNGTHSTDRYVTTLLYAERYQGSLFNGIMDEDIFR